MLPTLTLIRGAKVTTWNCKRSSRRCQVAAAGPFCSVYFPGKSLNFSSHYQNSNLENNNNVINEGIFGDQAFYSMERDGHKN